MRLKELLDSIHESADTSTPEEVLKACRLIIRVQEMKASESDTLTGAFKHGPLHDGDVPSKTGRDILVSEGFMAKVVVKGEDGFNACTYRGLMAFRILEALRG